MRYLWSWLQHNSPALEALGGLLSFAVACFAIPLLLAAKRAADRAAAAAEQLAFAAEAQAKSTVATRLSELNLEAARESAQATREHSQLIRAQMLAASRPFLVFQWVQSDGAAPVGILVNESTTAVAVRIAVRQIDGQPTINCGLDVATLGPRSHSVVRNLARIPGRASTIQAIYSSEDGRLFVTECRIRGDAPLSQHAWQVIRGEDPPRW